MAPISDDKFNGLIDLEEKSRGYTCGRPQVGCNTPHLLMCILPPEFLNINIIACRLF